MSSDKKGNVVWTYIGQILNIGVNLILLPITLRVFDTETFAVWQLFVMLYLFSNLIDFGFRPIFMRNIAYVYGGATNLIKEGIDHTAIVLDHPNYSLLKSLFYTMNRFYGFLSILMLVVLLGGGSYYIYYITESLPNQIEILYSWGIYAIGVAFSYYILSITSMLNGCGFVKQYNQVSAISKFIYFIVNVVLLLLEFGLLSIAIGMLVSSIANYLAAFYFMKKVGLQRMISQVNTKKENLLSTVGFLAVKAGVVNIAVFFTTRGSLFFASLFLSLEIVAQLGLTLQIIGFITLFCQLYLYAISPFISRIRITNQLEEIKKLIGESFVVFIIIYISAAILLVLFGTPLLQLIGSNTLLLPRLALLLFLIIYFLDTNHIISIHILMTKNIVPHFTSSILTGIALSFSSFLLLKYTDLGIYAIIISIGISQLVYQNWKWPLEVSRDLSISYFRVLNTGVQSFLTKFKFK